MADFEEKKYSIDAGPGKKMDGCPYSNYEDGHDIKDYIIPPKGYVFTGFIFDPDAKNQIYDGKLYAQYSKEPLKNRLQSNLWKVMLTVIIVAIIALIVLLATSVFKEPKSQNSATSKEPKTEVTTKPTKELERTDNSLSKTTKRSKKSKKEKKEKERKERKERKEKEKLAKKEKQEQERLAKKEKQEKERLEKKEKQEKKNKKEGKKNKKDKTENVQQQQQEPVAQPQEQVEQPQEPVTPAVVDPNVQFKKEFWDLVQHRNPSMDAYTDLYNKYKADVKGDEFNYLRYTILKNYVTFKAWYDNLKLIPESQLQSIESVDVLTKKINQ